MRRRVRIVVVCEDRLHEAFARAFLSGRGFDRREMTFIPASAGAGDAKRHVCREVGRQLGILRKFSGERRGLMYLIDADALTVNERRRAVEDTLRSMGIRPPMRGEPVFSVVPKWEIENWLAYLRGETVDENSNQYEKYRRRESAVYPLVQYLVDCCDEQDLPDPPESLAAACLDYPRFREWIKSH